MAHKISIYSVLGTKRRPYQPFNGTCPFHCTSYVQFHDIFTGFVQSHLLASFWINNDPCVFQLVCSGNFSPVKISCERVAVSSYVNDVIWQMN